jgi:hypothetical protein
MKKFLFLLSILTFCLSTLYAQKNDCKTALFVNGNEWDLTKPLSLKEKPKLDIRVVSSSNTKNKDIYAIDEIAFGPIQDSAGFSADGLIRAKNKDASLGIRVTTPFDLKPGDVVEYRIHQIFIRKENGSWEPIENSSAILKLKIGE